MKHGTIGNYHLAGIAGSGMYPLAQAMLAMGMGITGSDRLIDRAFNSPVIRMLRNAGVNLFPQDGSGLSRNTAGLVLSTAIEPDNPDVITASRLGIPLIHRSRMLQDIIGTSTCCAITGTCGKSTVTGMTGWILDQAGRDPCVVNGAPVINWRTSGKDGSFRKGSGGIWVIEADESDRSLGNYHPDWIVITNASKDHFELEETRVLFNQFAEKARLGLVSAVHDPGIFADFRPLTIAAGTSFSYNGAVFEIPMPGEHNARNALLAAMICEKMGIGTSISAAALATFRGIARRLELAGTVNGIDIFDDYAHNPEKIKASLQAVRKPGGRIFAVWRPHGFKPLKTMMQALADVFAEELTGNDMLILLPVYDAGGTADRSVASDMLAETINAMTGARMASCAELMEIPAKLATLPGKGDSVIVMGARDPELPALARQLIQSIRESRGGSGHRP